MTRHTTLVTLAVLPLLGVGLALPGAASAVGYAPVAGVSAPPPAPPTGTPTPTPTPSIDSKVPSIVASTPSRTSVAATTPAAAVPAAAAPTPAGQLPFTGIDLGVLTVAGGVLLGAGLLLRRTARDRGASS